MELTEFTNYCAKYAIMLELFMFFLKTDAKEVNILIII